MEGAQTPAGLAGQVRPRRRLALRRLTARPAESEAPGMKISGTPPHNKRKNRRQNLFMQVVDH
ncbi:hypothetical protein SD77_0213 [Bacillus badius]|uniref:Ribose 5-phosphate isomerase B n=1 Tax=Bacillus badius TaxID=1455 RepID=A0ABR5B052_BACBA|nr:hypothetical protein SD77_0213 [Bacillus badius]